MLLTPGAGHHVLNLYAALHDQSCPCMQTEIAASQSEAAAVNHACPSCDCAVLLAGTGGLSANCRSKWQEFIQALSRGLSNSHKVAAHSLKLHIAVMQAWDNRK